MSDFLKKIWNKEGTENVVAEFEDESIEVTLPVINDYLDMEKQYRQVMFIYEAAIRQLTAKLDILKEEFRYSNDRNPIESINSRIKSKESIIHKMERKGIPYTLNGMLINIHDIAGMRVVCPFKSDVYEIAKMLMNQPDLELISVKDYIENPKENGYRSLHLIVTIQVHFSDQMRKIPVEIQLRTIAMDFWASAEHQLRYKKHRDMSENAHRKLKKCAKLMAEADEIMDELSKEVFEEEVSDSCVLSNES